MSVFAGLSDGQRTLDLYRQRSTKHVLPMLDRRRVQEARPEHIGRIFAMQRSEGLAPWTIAGTQTIISAILKFALSRGTWSATRWIALRGSRSRSRSASTEHDG
jgi:hypothetical protein